MMKIYIGKALVIGMTSGHGQNATYCVNRQLFDKGEDLGLEKIFADKEAAEIHFNHIKNMLAD